MTRPDRTQASGRPAGRVDVATIERIASEALRAAARPPGGNPLVIGLELGFELLPCSPALARVYEFERTSEARLVFAAVGDPAEHAEHVFFALARGLLLRSREPHTITDAEALAARLRDLHAPSIATPRPAA